MHGTSQHICDRLQPDMETAVTVRTPSASEGNAARGAWAGPRKDMVQTTVAVADAWEPASAWRYGHRGRGEMSL